MNTTEAIWESIGHNVTVAIEVTEQEFLDLCMLCDDHTTQDDGSEDFWGHGEHADGSKNTDAPWRIYATLVVA